MKKMKKSSDKKTGPLARFLLKSVFLLAVAVFLFTCIFRVHRMTGNAMSPFVRDGDLCIFLKPDPAVAGDVVLYLDSDGNRKVGRIVAVEGQKVDFPEIGGYTVDEAEPVEEIPYETYQAEETEVQFPVALSEGEVFLMNDFRSLTDDSRQMGPVKVSNIEGKLLFLLRRRGF